MTGDTSRQRLGVFGGTFDPPHVGHLVTAVNVRHALQRRLRQDLVHSTSRAARGTPFRHSMIAA